MLDPFVTRTFAYFCSCTTFISLFFPLNDEFLSDFSASFSGERIRLYKMRFLLFIYMMYSSMTVAK